MLLVLLEKYPQFLSIGLGKDGVRPRLMSFFLMFLVDEIEAFCHSPWVLTTLAALSTHTTWIYYAFHLERLSSYTWPNNSSFYLSVWNMNATVTRRWSIVSSVGDWLSFKNYTTFLFIPEFSMVPGSGRFLRHAVPNTSMYMLKFVTGQKWVY